MSETGFRGFLRSFIKTFPPLKVVLYINDLICYLFSKLIDAFICLVRLLINSIYFIARNLYQPIYQQLIKIYTLLSDLTRKIPWITDWIARREYQQLKGKLIVPDSNEPVPHANDLVKRMFTYHGGIALALALYVFVYFVLIKHHTYTSVAIAFVLMLIYLVLIENSHNIRSIIMLCLPIMFTNRGRALIFCSMLALLANGPIRTLQHNVKQIHSSLTCCKQYLIVKGDEKVEENYVQRLVKVEEVVRDLVANIEQYARELKEQFSVIKRLAILIEEYIIDAVERLKEIVDICNSHSDQVFKSCVKKINKLYAQCRLLFSPFTLNLCRVLGGVEKICSIVRAPDVLCRLPAQIVDLVERSIGAKLRQYILVIENEFYVDIDIDRKYFYNMSKSKSYLEVTREIKFDVRQKFWYIHFIYRIFNLLSLILVVFILATATVYHMHYLSDRAYDNMYLDDSLVEIDENRKRKLAISKRRDDTPLDILSLDQELEDYELILDENNNQAQIDQVDEETSISQSDDENLFPLSEAHARQYLKPLSLTMNDAEKSKLKWSGLVWLVIVGYISFFVILDFTFFELIQFLVDTLREIMFDSDLPLVDFQTKTNIEGDSRNQTVVRYNRTYLSSLRKRVMDKPKRANLSGQNDTMRYTNYTNSSVRAFYRRLMDSIERDMPDDVAILDSLEQCLPRPEVPRFSVYRRLLYLALFTFGAVIVEAYALRTRHCIANLYYPRQAKRRSVWLYRKMMAEKPNYNDDDDDTGFDEENSESAKENGREKETDEV